MPSYMNLICCIITGVLGYEVYIDENGDAEGNYTLLTLEYDEDDHGNGNMIPAGDFKMNYSGAGIPVSINSLPHRDTF